MYISIWSNAELQLSLICGNLPAARLFFLKHFPGLAGSESESSEGSSFRLKPRSQGWGYRQRKAHGNSIQVSAMDTLPTTSLYNETEVAGIQCQKTYTVQNVSDDEQTLVTKNSMVVPQSLQRNS